MKQFLNLAILLLVGVTATAQVNTKACTDLYTVRLQELHQKEVKAEALANADTYYGTERRDARRELPVIKKAIVTYQEHYEKCMAGKPHRLEVMMPVEEPVVEETTPVVTPTRQSRNGRVRKLAKETSRSLRAQNNCTFVAIALTAAGSLAVAPVLIYAGGACALASGVLSIVNNERQARLNEELADIATRK